MPTRSELDVAIQGDGFFEVKMPDGSMAYTRSGEFRLRPDRTVVNAAGLEVMTDGGNPMVLMPEAEADRHQPGRHRVPRHDLRIGKLSIQKFSNPAALMPTAGAHVCGEERRRR